MSTIYAENSGSGKHMETLRVGQIQCKHMAPIWSDAETRDKEGGLDFAPQLPQLLVFFFVVGSLQCVEYIYSFSHLDRRDTQQNWLPTSLPNQVLTFGLETLVGGIALQIIFQNAAQNLSFHAFEKDVHLLPNFGRWQARKDRRATLGNMPPPTRPLQVVHSLQKKTACYYF